MYICTYTYINISVCTHAYMHMHTYPYHRGYECKKYTHVDEYKNNTKHPHTHIMDSFPRWICFSSSFALALPLLLPSMTPADKGLESSVKEVAGEQVILFNHHFQHIVR